MRLTTLTHLEMAIRKHNEEERQKLRRMMEHAKEPKKYGEVFIPSHARKPYGD